MSLSNFLLDKQFFIHIRDTYPYVSKKREY